MKLSFAHTSHKSMLKPFITSSIVKDSPLEGVLDSEQSLRLALHAGHMGVWEYNLKKKSISWSDGFEPLYDLRRGNITGSLKKFLAHILPQDRQRVKKNLIDSINNKKLFEDEFRIIRDDKQIRWIYKIGEVQLDVKGNVTRIIGVGVDITDRKIADEKIRESENKFRSVFEGSMDIIFITDSSSKILDANKTACKLLHSAKSDLLDKNLLDIISVDDRKRFSNAWKRLQKYSKLRDTFSVVFPDGESHMLEYSATSNFLPGKTLFVIRDISESMEEKNRRENMIAVTSHELRTPIASIKVFIDILKRQLGDKLDEKSIQYLEKIDEKTDTLTQLIGDLLDVARIDKDQMDFYWEMFDFEEFMNQLLLELQLSTKTHKLIYKSKSSLNIVSDRNRLSQILINIIRNAVKYSPQANKVYIKSEISKGQLLISIKDLGTGISEKDLTKVFDIFYRVHAPTQKKVYGLGVGLYITSQIINKMGGKIWATSKLDEGSVFYIKLPVIPKKNINI